MKSKVIITEIKEPREYKPGKFIYSFMAKSGDKTLKFETFSKTIYTALTKDAEVDIEYEEKNRQAQDGNTYIDRTVNQVWINGEPVRKDEKKSYYPKQDTRDQTAVKAIIELQVAGIDVPTDITEAMFNWIRSALGIKPDLVKVAEAKGGKVTEKIETKTDELPGVNIPEFGRKFSDFVFIMQKEFNFSEQECKDAMHGLTANPEGYKKAFIKAWQGREGK